MTGSKPVALPLGYTPKAFNYKPLTIQMVAMAGFEPATHALWMRCSNQLSYIALSFEARIIRFFLISVNSKPVKKCLIYIENLSL